MPKSVSSLAPRRARIAATMIVAAVALLMGGCATRVVNDMTVFHDWPADASERTYVLVRADHQRDSLRHAAYEHVVRDELSRAGFTESASSRFEIRFDFAAARTVRRVVNSAPYVTPYVWYGYRAMPGGIVQLHGPLWWDWRERARTHDEVVQTHDLRLEIRDRQDRPPRQVYEASAAHEWPHADARAGLRILMRVLLSNFPGPSGTARQVMVELKD